MFASDYYKELSDCEKLTMILTTSLNDILHKVSFGVLARVILAVNSESDIDFYLWQNGYEVGHQSVALDPTLTYSEDDLLYLINSVCAEADDPTDEEDRRVPMSRAMNLGSLNGKGIYALPVACCEGFPRGLLWQKIYEFFIEGWSKILSDTDKNILFEYSNPQEALDSLYVEWSWVNIACCRALHEGGFNAGYGDPYESELVFHAITRMSSLNYEKRQSRGAIVAIADDKEEKTADLLIRFADSIPLTDELSKTYRKLLEMTTDKIALAFGTTRVLGLVDVSLFDWRVIICGLGKWKYYYKDQVIFTVDNGKVMIGKEASQVAYHLSEDERCAVSSPAIVESIIQEAMKQEHGTCVLFTDNAVCEVNRLSKFRRCIRIETVSLFEHPEMVWPLTAIDGAIILDLDGNCEGVGAILDGEAQYAGDFGRGARFNSAINYVGWKKRVDFEHQYCIVVISEDGIHDIISTRTLDQIEKALDFPYSNG